MHVGINRISLLIEIHQLMFSHTLWYKGLKVYRCLNCKHHFAIRLSPLIDSGVRYGIMLPVSGHAYDKLRKFFNPVKRFGDVND